MKKLITLILALILSCNVFSQNITNTLGLGGIFSIKDNTSTYFSLSQSTGHVTLGRNIFLAQTINSSTGVILKDGVRFLHNYQPSGTNGRNTFLGVEAGNFTMNGIGANSSYNTGIGHFSLANLTNGNANTAVGHLSLYFNQSGSSNTAIGDGAMVSNTTGNNNTAIGTASLYSNTTGNYNTALGFYSLVSNISGEFNTALGYYSLRNNTTGSNNIASGYQSLYSNSTGNENTAYGIGSLYANTTGTRNTSVGSFSLYNNITGENNTAFGLVALYSNTSGFNNTAFGFQGLYRTTGSDNTALGRTAGFDVVSGNNNTCIGYNSQPSLSTVSNEITLGNNQITSLRCNVTSITSLSDARDKRNIKDLSLGLDFIMMLKPRQFNWDRREWYENNISDGSKINNNLTAGFIAQELDDAQQQQNAEWLDLVYKSNPEKIEASTGNLLPVMVKAIQELKEENDRLRLEIEELKNVSEKLARVEELVKQLSLKPESSTMLINTLEEK